MQEGRKGDKEMIGKEVEIKEDQEKLKISNTSHSHHHI